MIPSSFDYHSPASVDEALALLREHGDEAKLLAGGHSLLPAMKLRLSEPGHLVDIGRLAELQYIREEDDHITIGAATTHHDIESSETVKNNAPLLAQAAAVIGDPQVRNLGTLGGSIAHADPAADYPAALLAANAELGITGPEGARSIAVDAFFIDLYLTSLAPGEIITEVRLSGLRNRTGSIYLKFPHPASRFAVVGCAAVVAMEDGICIEVRVAFNGVANAAFRDVGVEEALTGQLINADTEVLSDSFAGEEYRRHLARVYARRALEKASAVAGQD